MGAWYPEGIRAVMDGSVDLDTADVRVVLVTSGYTFNVAHDFLNDIPGGNRVGTPVALASRTIIADGNNRSLDAADTVFVGLTGSAVNACALFVHTGVDSTARLLGYIDGLTITPDGSDVTLRWNAAGILAIDYVP